MVLDLYCLGLFSFIFTRFKIFAKDFNQLIILNYNYNFSTYNMY